MKRILVYYSHSGNVKEIAEKIAAETGCALIALEPVSPLKGTGFGAILKGGGQATFGQKPELKETPDLSGAEEVILGFPVESIETQVEINCLIDEIANFFRKER